MSTINGIATFFSGCLVHIENMPNLKSFNNNSAFGFSGKFHLHIANGKPLDQVIHELCRLKM